MAKTKTRAATAVTCSFCGKIISRKADLPRHLKTHATNKEELMHACPYFGCTYKALQSSNLQTHLNIHAGERPHKCPEEGCEFDYADPGSLTRHRKEAHDYRPRGSSGEHPSANARKAARQSRRISPYTTSSSSSSSSPSGSASPMDPSTDTHRSPFLELPELYPSSSPLPTHHHVGEGSKNALAAYSTELITKRAEVNDGHLVQAPHADSAPPLASGSGVLTAPKALPVAEHPQLAVPEQRRPYAADVAFHDNFYAQFDDWQLRSPSLPAPVSSSFPSPAVSYTDANAPVPASFPLPVASYDASVSSTFPSPAVSYTANIAPVPASFALPVASYDASVSSSFPSPAVSYTANIAPVPASIPSPAISYYAPIPTRAFLPPYETRYKVDTSAPAPLPLPMVSYTGGNAPAPSSFPSPVASYTANNAPVPAFFPSPMVYNAHIPTRGFLPPYEAHYKGDASASAPLPFPMVSYTGGNTPAPTSFPSPVASYSLGNASVPSSFPSPLASYTTSNAPLPAPVASYSLGNASVPSSFPSPLASYTANNAPVPAFPSPVVYNAPIPTHAFLPPYEVQNKNTIYNPPFEYHGYGYTTGATSFDALFNFSHPESFATPDIGVGGYPRAVDANQGYQSYSYTTPATNTACAHAGTSGFGTQGLYA